MARRALSPDQLAVVQAVRPWTDEYPGPLVVGVSGGADSMALAAAAAHCAPERVTAVVVDHGLQPDSVALSDQVALQLTRRGIAAEVRAVDVDPLSPDGLEAAARRERLTALVADGRSTVMLGHTLDDQAETVLLGLARGSGSGSLQAMAPTTRYLAGRLVRPMLGLRRAQVRRACLDWGIEPWEDPMNDDPRFLRVRVRHEVLPLMEDVLGPGLTEALGRTATLARHDNDLLGRLAEDSMRDLVRGDFLDAPGLLHLHPALRGRVLRDWLRTRGCTAPTMQHVQSVAELAERWRGQVGVDLPGGLRVVRRGDHLLVEPGPAG